MEKDITKYSNLIDRKPMHIATVQPGNRPNLAVAADVKVISPDEIVISVNEMVMTPKNLDYCSDVVLTCFNDDWEGLRIFGKGRYYEEGKYFEIAKKEFDAEYFAENGKHIRGCIVVKISDFQEYK